MSRAKCALVSLVWRSVETIAPGAPEAIFIVSTFENRSKSLRPEKTLMEARHKKTVAVKAIDAQAKATESFLSNLLGLYMIQCVWLNIAAYSLAAKHVSVNLHISQFFSNPNFRSSRLLSSCFVSQPVPSLGAGLIFKR